MTKKCLLLLFLGLAILTTPSIARLLTPTIVPLADGNENLSFGEENIPTTYVAPKDLTSFHPLPIQLQGEDQVSLLVTSKSNEVLEPENKHKHKRHQRERHHKEHHKSHAPPPEVAEAPEPGHHKEHHKSHAPPPKVAEAPKPEHKHKHHHHKRHAPPPEVAEAPKPEHKHKHHHHKRHAPPPKVDEAPNAPPPEQDASDS